MHLLEAEGEIANVEDVLGTDEAADALVPFVIHHVGLREGPNNICQPARGEMEDLVAIRSQERRVQTETWGGVRGQERRVQT